jgi:butyrate kinase
MTPTRTGALPLVPVIEMCFSGEYTKKQMLEFMTSSGGFTNHLGTSDLREIMERIRNGDEQAKLLVDAMIHQVGKEIAAYAGVLKGKVDAILLTGGMVHNEYVVEQVTEMVKFIGPVKTYPGEFEMEAMGSAAFRALSGTEATKAYEGER